MSYTSMLLVPQSGPVEEIKTFRNAWGGAMRIWNALNQKRFGESFPMFSEAKLKRFWRLVDDPSLEDYERLSLAFTFDKMICERDRAADLAKALREFDMELPAQDGTVNHIPAIADALDAHSGSACVGFAFIQTSIDGDAWYVPDVCTDAFHQTGNPDECCPTCEGDKDEIYRLFDWSKDSQSGVNHFMLFEKYGERPVVSKA